jgi:hemerythrin HHE cation binding domain-containing protein
MNERPAESLAETLTREHRRLDELFGRFLAAAMAGAIVESLAGIEEFDRELRRHTALEEERLLGESAGHRLAPPDVEGDEERLSRELRLEHVQIREVSAMILRQLSERGDVASARALAGNLARRWDAHTSREERELFRRAF